jgi:hypothetical protein
VADFLKAMKSAHKVATFAVVVLLVATGYGLFRTRGQPDTLATSGSSTDRGRQSGSVVDQSTFWNARWLVQLPTTVEERQVAEDALHLADKDMDLAFAAAVREVEQHPPALSAEPRRLKPGCRNRKTPWQPTRQKSHSLQPRTQERAGARKTNWMTG